MTQKIEVLLACDMGPDEHKPGDDVETIVFSWDGTPLTMELCGDHLEKFEKRLKPFLDQARRAEPPRRVRRASAGGQDVTHIREWAREHGYTVGEKGRLPAEVMEAYEAQQDADPDDDNEVAFVEDQPEELTS